jgi:hypothetical protein
MKRLAIIILGFALTASFAGCGGAKDDSVVVNPNSTTAKTESAAPGSAAPAASASEQPQDEGLYFESNGVKVHAYNLAKDVLDGLGEPKGSFEAPSCAYQGKDVFYYYKGFQLTVNNIDGADHVTGIMVVDDTVSIPQGLKIGNTQDEMLACMGSGYTESAGLYQFVSGNTTLQIQIKNGVVASITYLYTPPQK